MTVVSMLAFCFLLANTSFANETLTIENSVDTKGVSGEITDGNIDWGQLGAGESKTTQTLGDSQTLTNSSIGFPVNIRIQVVQWNGSGDNVLNPVMTAPALDEFRMGIPDKAVYLPSTNWGEILYTLAEDASEVVDFELELGSAISVVDSYSGFIRVAFQEVI
jgi:hypothetical protein